MKLGGFHHDPSDLLGENNIFNLVNKFSKEGFYGGELYYNGERIKNITFFPVDWSREKVVIKIYEAYDNFIKNGETKFKKRGNKYIIDSVIEEGINIIIVIKEDGLITSAYPILEIKEIL